MIAEDAASYGGGWPDKGLRMPEPGDQWQHAEGDVYTVIAVTSQPDPEKADHFPRTVFYRGTDGRQWPRKLDEWWYRFTFVRAVPSTAAQGATDAKAHTMACDLQAEQTFLGPCYESCDDSGKARWKRLQRVIDHLTAPTPVADSGAMLDLIRRIQQGKPFSRVEVLDALEVCGAFEIAAAKPVSDSGATWKLVPVEPTETMVIAANEVEYCEDGITRGQLRAAINAAPTPVATAAQGATLTDGTPLAIVREVYEKFAADDPKRPPSYTEGALDALDIVEQRIVDVSPTRVADSGAMPDHTERQKASDSRILPERDSSKPAEEQGLFRKFDIRRVDKQDQPGGKHRGCEYFVLDVAHDVFAKAALVAYAAACEASHPALAVDMRKRYYLESATPNETGEAKPVTFTPCTCFDDTARKYCAKSRVCSRIEAQGSTGGPNA